ncbi:7-cyano-7-deazaguanine synthase, partial [Campylobacter jejuni]|uniref:7-cyano-7-deazaguanine synthase n=1 Tax=Campylobacter jejuni TaxID=197 RepID=UPI002043747A
MNDYEMKLINERILPFVPEGLRAEFSYILGIREGRNGESNFVKNEFENRTYKNAKIELCSGSLSSFNENEFGAIDGKALKYCDKIAAYIEAGLSISYGVKSKELESGFLGMHEFFKENPTIDGVNFFEICESDAPPITYVPFRNGIFLSIAGSLAEKENCESIFIGVVEEDGSGYPDCTDGFAQKAQEFIN